MNDSAIARHQASSDPAAIWLRRGNESAAAYSAFAVYREQTPPRSIRKAGERSGEGTGLQGWSEQYKWVERAAAYTDHLDQLVLAAHEDDIVRRRREANEQVFQLARQLLRLVHERLSGVVDDEGSSSLLRLTRMCSRRGTSCASSSRAVRRCAVRSACPSIPTVRFQVSSKDFRAVFRAVMDLAEERMEPEVFRPFVRDCRAVLAKQFGH